MWTKNVDMRAGLLGWKWKWIQCITMMRGWQGEDFHESKMSRRKFVKLKNCFCWLLTDCSRGQFHRAPPCIRTLVCDFFEMMVSESVILPFRKLHTCGYSNHFYVLLPWTSLLWFLQRFPLEIDKSLRSCKINHTEDIKHMLSLHYFAYFFRSQTAQENWKNRCL